MANVYLLLIFCLCNSLCLSFKIDYKPKDKEQTVFSNSDSEDSSRIKDITRNFEILKDKLQNAERHAKSYYEEGLKFLFQRILQKDEKDGSDADKKKLFHKSILPEVRRKQEVQRKVIISCLSE